MPLFEKPFALQFPVSIEDITFVFYVNQNLYVINSECTSVPHNHHDYELRYVATGVGNQMIDGQRYSLAKGNCLVTKPLEYHWQEWIPNTPPSAQYNVRFSVKAPPKANEKAWETYNRFLTFLEEIRVFRDEKGRLMTYFELLSREFYEKRDGFLQTATNLCALIMTEVIRLSDAELKIFTSSELKYHGHERSRVDHFFLARYLTNVKVQDLAAEMNVSVRQVSYVLHRLYGMSFVQKLTEMRLQHAVMLLINTNQPIQDISRKCGFQNHNYFARCFQRMYLITPSGYRKYMRKKEKTKISDLPIMLPTAQEKQNEDGGQ